MVLVTFIAAQYAWISQMLGGVDADRLIKCVLQELEEGIGDVDLFTLQEDKETLTVNAKWLQHLQARLLLRQIGELCKALAE